MPSLVEELERDAYDSSACLSNMLRKAKAIAAKLQLEQPLHWVEAELNGYSGIELPEYRQIIGQASFFNPYSGWRPIMFDNAEIERGTCLIPIYNPIKEIEHLIDSKGKPSITLDGNRAKILCDLAGMPLFTISVFCSGGQLISILDTVRNKVLDWSLSLQSNGIRGEGMSFLPEEKAKVSGKDNTYNIGSIGNFAGNLGGKSSGNVNTYSMQNLSQEIEKVASLTSQIRAYQSQMGLDPNQEAEVAHHLDRLEAEVRMENPKPGVIVGLLNSIKTIAEGATGSLIATGVAAAISNIKL